MVASLRAALTAIEADGVVSNAERDTQDGFRWPKNNSCSLTKRPLSVSSAAVRRR